MGGIPNLRATDNHRWLSHLLVCTVKIKVRHFWGTHPHRQSSHHKFFHPWKPRIYMIYYQSPKCTTLSCNNLARSHRNQRIAK